MGVVPEFPVGLSNRRSRGLYSLRRNPNTLFTFDFLGVSPWYTGLSDTHGSLPFARFCRVQDELSWSFCFTGAVFLVSVSVPYVRLFFLLQPVKKKWIRWPFHCLDFDPYTDFRSRELCVFNNWWKIRLCSTEYGNIGVCLFLFYLHDRDSS